MKYRVQYEERSYHTQIVDVKHPSLIAEAVTELAWDNGRHGVYQIHRIELADDPDQVLYDYLEDGEY